MAKTKYEISEDEILSDDGIFAPKYTTRYDNAENCCCCGCAILSGEKAVRIYANGDMIHRQCWQDYAEEYTDAFGKEFTYEEDNPEY